MSTVYTTIDYDYRHENEGTGLILVPRKYGVCKWDKKATSYMYGMVTVLIYVEYTQVVPIIIYSCN